MSSINHHLLPGALRELARVLGETSAFKLVERRGGGRLVVPRKVHPDHRLMDELGLQVFAALVDAYGGEVLTLPKYDSVARQLRHERVRKHRADGLSIDRVAIATGYTRRQVFNILASDAPEDAQLDMFELLGDDEEPGGPLAATRDAALPDPSATRANDPFGLTRR